MGDHICYLHAGTAKTGTTAIQYRLATSGDILARAGLYYPDFSENLMKTASGKPTAGNGVLPFVQLRNGKFERALATIARLIDGVDKFIISCEAFCNLPAEALAAFRNGLEDLGYQLRCSVCYRPQTDFITSFYLQDVKSGKVDWRESLDEFVARAVKSGSFAKRWNWLSNANKLAEVFGREQLTVLWYPCMVRQGPDAVVRTFFEWLSVPTEGNDPQAIRNPSPNLEAMHVLRMLNGMGLGGRQFADAFLAQAQRQGLLVGQVRLSAAVRKQVDDATREANRLLLSRFTDISQLSYEETEPRVVAEARSAFSRERFAELLRLAAGILESGEGRDVSGSAGPGHLEILNGLSRSFEDGRYQPD